MKTINIDAVKTYIWSIQSQICHALSQVDGEKTFKPDVWTSKLGQGISCVLENGRVFEKAGVNVSYVKGEHLPTSATEKRPQLAGCQFTAVGVSLVIHPHNPYVPTTHANVRFFLASQQDEPVAWWFGGGMDLTPYYGFKEDCVHWHQIAKDATDPFGDDLYLRFKNDCDRYFYLPHRQEARGIGGLFFDDYQEQSFEHSFALTRSIADHFLKAYVPIVERRLNTPYGEKEKAFQCYRRGRYVEFNLLYDRGTLFGLQSGGRTESILMSLPPEVHWQYNWTPQPNSPEAALYTDFLPIQHWI